MTTHRSAACACLCRRRLALSAPHLREREPVLDTHSPAPSRPKNHKNAHQKQKHPRQQHHNTDPFGFSKLMSNARPFPSRPPPGSHKPVQPPPPPRPYAVSALSLLRSTDIQTGDLVLVVRKGQPQLGAVIDHATGLRTLLGNGFQMTHGPSEVLFRVPGVYDFGSDKTANVQADVRGISRRASDMRLELQGKFGQVYDHFTFQAGKDAVPLAEYLEQVFGAETPLTIDHVMAAVLHLISDPAKHLTSFATLHQRTMVHFRPVRSLTTLTNGQRLIAQASASEEAFHTSSLASFLVKCRTLIDLNKPKADPAAAASSSSAEPLTPTPEFAWTQDDLTLLACLREVALGPRASLSAFAFVGTHILGPLGYKPEVRFPGPTLSLLLDLGVYSRIDNFPLYAQAYTLQPLEGLGFANADAAAARAEKESREVAVVDGLDSVRRVFGKDVEVYTVDDPGAHEIDDGISVEMDAATGGVAWIHVHVADPTAFIDRDSTLAKFALDRVQTVYFPEGTYPMLPGTIGSGLMSLGGRTNGESVRAVTISFRVNTDGDVVDARVEPSVVHTVIPRAYDLVDTVLDMIDMPGVSLPSEAANRVAPPRVLHSDPACDELLADRKQFGLGGPVTESQATVFRALQQIAKQHFHFRHKTGGAFNPTSTNAMVSAEIEGGMPALTPLEAAVPRARPQARAVDIRLHRDVLPLSPARQMIAELMIMAGRAAAMVATDAKLAVPFRSQPAPDLSQAYLPWAAGQGATANVFASRVHPTSLTLNMRDTLASLALMLPADQAATPGPHYQMGLSASPGYVKITSPLRRAVDMLGHWQLKSHFAHMRGLAGPTTHKMMSADALTRAMSAMRERERVIKAVQRAREAWWALEALRMRQALEQDLTYAARVVRVFDRPPAVLGVPPGSVGVAALVALVDAGVRAMVWMPGVAATMALSGGVGGVEVGEWVSVWIRQVCPVDGQVVGEVVRRWVEVDPRAD
ncbi:hypothetical protein BCR44DRAFT_42830 [Catenaria anguillulae PL171]|uniref:RNB domain-containing protein n=1 Tax=Catenaria anguillulae PL171 TaxID=765915 RepID=A0A1Y2HP92_9FUNG|nr:hypothetical protein BCR44DRAFT_42830 [Catenaria anguillulae PL171]